MSYAAELVPTAGVEPASDVRKTSILAYRKLSGHVAAGDKEM